MSNGTRMRENTQTFGMTLNPMIGSIGRKNKIWKEHMKLLKKIQLRELKLEIQEYSQVCRDFRKQSLLQIHWF